MSSATPQASRHLEDFVELLRALDDAGLDFAVIGGCAVGAYARLRGTTVVSADLDIYVRDSTLAELLDWASTHGVTIDSRPQPRSVPVAVLRWRGEEINVLTASSGLPPPDAVLRTAREFVPLATDPVKRRFLAHRVPRRGDAERLSMAAESAEERAELEAIIARRTFEAAL